MHTSRRSLIASLFFSARITDDVMPIQGMCVTYATHIMQLRHHLCEPQRRLLPKAASFGPARTMASGLGAATLCGSILIKSGAFAGGRGKSDAAGGGAPEEDAAGDLAEL